MKKAVLLIAIATLSTTAFAKRILPTEQERVTYMKKAQVWFAPSWIDSQYRFSNSLDLVGGPDLKKSESQLRNDSIECKYKVDPDPGTGWTRKFKCDMETSDASNPTIELKVKYRESNAEIYSELLSTRLFWALGFGADRMYFVKEVNCLGCSDYQFKKRKIDVTTLETPRTFTPTAIERKFKGTTIDKPTVKRIPAPGPSHGIPNMQEVPDVTTGWSFHELLNELSYDPAVRQDQITKRSALALLSAFINHVDNKAVNQRLVCLSGATDDGKCQGDTAMIVQDLGATFGAGFSLREFDLARVDIVKWGKTQIWSKPEVCEAGVTGWIGQSFKHVIINESGREFLVKLLKGFTEGADGRARVEQLFKSAHTEYHSSATPGEWADLFMKKLHDLEFPMGEAHPDFKCPQ
jgi:hypothetical protein